MQAKVADPRRRRRLSEGLLRSRQRLFGHSIFGGARTEPQTQRRLIALAEEVLANSTDPVYVAFLSHGPRDETSVLTRTMEQAGEKMFHLDETVPLSPLVSGSSPAKSLQLSVQRGYVPARQPDSPTPLPSGGWQPRNSLSRYSQDHHAGSRHSHGSESISSHSIDSSGQSMPQDVTECSFALSSQSTELSISSVLSSPCPAPRQRRVPMLTGHRERRFSFRLSLDKIQDDESQKVDEQGHLRPTRCVGDEVEKTFESAQAVAVIPTVTRRHESVCAPSPSSPRFPSRPSEEVAEELPSSPSAPDPGSTRRMEQLRMYCLLAHEAETEIKRSLVVWPDTEFSREMVARASNAPFHFST